MRHVEQFLQKRLHEHPVMPKGGVESWTKGAVERKKENKDG